LLIAAVVVTLSGMSVDAPPFTPLVPQPDYIVLSFIEVSRVERRPIAADDVQLPPTLPALDWWSTDLPSFDSPSTPDHETVMGFRAILRMPRNQSARYAASGRGNCWMKPSVRAAKSLSPTIRSRCSFDTPAINPARRGS
jgi:hypothetical protein